MRALAVTAAALAFACLAACGHNERGFRTLSGGGGGGGGSHFSERGGGGGGGGGRPSAPIATRMERGFAHTIVRAADVAVAVTAVGIQATEASEATDDSDTDTQAAYDRRLATTRKGPQAPPPADPCQSCAPDETCFYADYVCPATTAQVAPIAPR